MQRRRLSLVFLRVTDCKESYSELTYRYSMTKRKAISRNISIVVGFTSGRDTQKIVYQKQLEMGGNSRSLTLVSRICSATSPKQQLCTLRLCIEYTN